MSLFEDMTCLSCGKLFKDHSNVKLNICTKVIELVLKYPKMFPYKMESSEMKRGKGN